MPRAAPLRKRVPPPGSRARRIRYGDDRDGDGVKRTIRAATAGLDRQVVLLSLTSLVVMLGASVISPVLPLYAREFGVSYSGAGS